MLVVSISNSWKVSCANFVSVDDEEEGGYDDELPADEE